MKMKRYSSIAMIAFTVFHDDKEEPTSEEIRDGLLRRIQLLDSEGSEGYVEAVDGEIYDTVEEDENIDTLLSAHDGLDISTG